MNALRKKKFLPIFQEMYAGGKTLDEIKQAMESEEHALAAEEIAELLEDIINPDPNENSGSGVNSSNNNPPPNPGQGAGAVGPGNNLGDANTAAAPANRSGKLAPYYKYKVKPKYEMMRFKGKKAEEVLVGYERTGECLQVTNIDSRHAQILNQQTPISMVYYFPNETDTFLDAELFD